MSRDAATEGPRGRDLIVADIVARTGIDEAMIERLVRSFYGRARRDTLLGPIFDGTVQDWERHMTRICGGLEDFCSAHFASSDRKLSSPTDP